MLTERLEIRPPVESDRARFVEFFRDPEFMVFSDGVCTLEAAHARFDGMIATCLELPYGKQSVVERSSGATVGYCGVAGFDFEGERRLEFGYRLVPHARGRGYATEAGRAVLALMAQTFRGVMLAMIDPTNAPSHNVAGKLGFEFWKQAIVDDGFRADMYRLSFG